MTVAWRRWVSPDVGLRWLLDWLFRGEAGRLPIGGQRLWITRAESSDRRGQDGLYVDRLSHADRVAPCAAVDGICRMEDVAELNIYA